MTAMDLEKWKWWTDTMEYVRTVSGTVYGDQLFKLARKHYAARCGEEIPASRENIVCFLNENTPTGRPECFLKVDPVTDGIYTIPSQRIKLDELLFTANGAYIYNPYLYLDRAERPDTLEAITFDALLGLPFFDEVFRLSEDGELSVDLTALRAHRIPAFRDFDLARICEHFRPRSESFRIGRIKASQMVFLGETRLVFEPDDGALHPLCRGMCFSEAAFCGPFSAENLVFSFSAGQYGPRDDYDESKIDFRNVRFFDSVSFRDVRISGDAADHEITFEDARIEDEIEFINVDFGHANVYFFQTVVGEYVSCVEKAPAVPEKPHRVRFLNISIADDSVIDFSDAEISGAELLFVNIPCLPQTKLCLAPIRTYRDGVLSEGQCPRNYLLIRNCEIQKTLFIGNFAEISFLDSFNYSKIVDMPDWGAFPEDGAYRSMSRGLFGTYISNPILRAIYNNRQLGAGDNAANELAYAKAKDFIMLKENFCAAGKYDEEDEAFILYMEFKPYINSELRRDRRKSRRKPYKEFWSNLLYKCLYATGKFGISPSRVVWSLVVSVLAFTLIYWVAACVQGIEAFSIGGTMGSVWDYANDAAVANAWSSSLLLKLLVSLLYSLEGVIPFVSQFEPISLFVCIVTALENALGSFLVGYFSVAVVRKTLR